MVFVSASAIGAEDVITMMELRSAIAEASPGRPFTNLVANYYSISARP
jgi:hypothetical protein